MSLARPRKLSKGRNECLEESNNHYQARRRPLHIYRSISERAGSWHQEGPRGLAVGPRDYRGRIRAARSAAGV